MAVTHDYTSHRWGHALHDPVVKTIPAEKTLTERLFLKKPKAVHILTCLGHGRVRAGDFVEVRMKSGGDAKFLVREIEHFYNPKDMFKIKRADFVGYVDERVT